MCLGLPLHGIFLSTPNIIRDNFQCTQPYLRTITCFLWENKQNSWSSGSVFLLPKFHKNRTIHLSKGCHMQPKPLFHRRKNDRIQLFQWPLQRTTSNHLHLQYIYIYIYTYIYICIYIYILYTLYNYVTKRQAAPHPIRMGGLRILE